jgi:hypothetical protein
LYSIDALNEEIRTESIGIPLAFKDASVSLPKFHVLSRAQLQGVFLGRLFIRAKKLDGPNEVSVATADVSSILWHWRPA